MIKRLASGALTATSATDVGRTPEALLFLEQTPDSYARIRWGLITTLIKCRVVDDAPAGELRCIELALVRASLGTPHVSEDECSRISWAVRLLMRGEAVNSLTLDFSSIGDHHDDDA